MLLSTREQPIVVNSLGWLKVITCSFKHNNERMMMRRRAKKVVRMFRIMQRLRHMFSHRFCIRSQFLLDGFFGGDFNASAPPHSVKEKCEKFSASIHNHDSFLPP